jgi:hypothetical protein
VRGHVPVIDAHGGVFFETRLSGSPGERGRGGADKLLTHAGVAAEARIGILDVFGSTFGHAADHGVMFVAMPAIGACGGVVMANGDWREFFDPWHSDPQEGLIFWPPMETHLVVWAMLASFFIGAVAGFLITLLSPELRARYRLRRAKIPPPE